LRQRHQIQITSFLELFTLQLKRFGQLAEQRYGREAVLGQLERDLEAL
jgi:hypothetical protein